jgi:hypothetical protein
MMGAVGDTLSQMSVRGYYDAFGNLTQPARLEIRSIALLHFRLNLAALPYQTRLSASDEALLPGVDAERDDIILERLERESEVVFSNEQVQLASSNAPLKNTLPPIREIAGRWRESTLAVPMTYQVKLTPTHAGTSVKIEVEQTDNGDPSRKDSPTRVAQDIRKLIVAPLPKRPPPKPSLREKIPPR